MKHFGERSEYFKEETQFKQITDKELENKCSVVRACINNCKYPVKKFCDNC